MPEPRAEAITSIETRIVSSVDRYTFRQYVGKRIRKIRQSKGITLQSLADKRIASYPYFSRLENGRSALTFDVAYQLAKTLGVSTDAFSEGWDGLEIEA